MAKQSVHIIETGVANIASMIAAFERLGASPELTRDVADVRDGEFVVLPGVGSFGAGMARLDELDMREALVERAEQGRPLFAVCLGLQLLCSASEESPGVAGLGIVDATITRFPDTVRIPQFGWNSVSADADCKLLTSGYAYFANSYRLEEGRLEESRLEQTSDWCVARSDHGGPFVAAMERGNLLACQFHPEISGKWGLGLIERWLSC
ncbi:MAG: imidazole glycerol phosphate synthase subunit HisH [Persicimonas sp.]